LQYVAGHDNIKTTMRYVHSREAAVHKLFARLADLQRPEDRIACNKSVQNPVQLEMPSQEELAKLLISGSYKVRKWWNWQTHHLEGVAPKGVGVQIPPSAPILML
jgi:hypothetical protein